MQDILDANVSSMAVTGLPLSLLDSRPIEVVPGSAEDRLVEATLRCVARWGTAKTSLGDVADEAGVSRATLYRTFNGGKEDLLLKAAVLEINRFFDDLGERLASASTLEGLIARGVSSAGRAIAERPALLPLVTHFLSPGVRGREREGEQRSLLSLVTECATPHLARFLVPKHARAVADLLARLALTFALLPSDEVDITDEESVMTFIREVLTFPPTGFGR